MKWAYYSENDPFAAAWLRELIKDNLIAPGEVDERSIEDVTPDELRSFRQCHFFAGIGVWSLALRLCGVPDDAPIWTGSCPCQPFSAAGKGEGFADDRHLWPAFHFLIEQCRPQLVLGEQVAGADGDTWLDLVQSDLDATAYAFGAAETVAAGFGAPHKRSRNYWMAYAQNGHWRGREWGSEERTWEAEFWRKRSASGGFVDGMAAVGQADSERAGLEGFRGDGRDGDEPGRIGADAARSASEGSELGGLADDELQQRPDGKPEVGNGNDARRRKQGAAAPAGLRGAGGMADDEGSGRREKRENAGWKSGGDRSEGIAAGSGDGGGAGGMAMHPNGGSQRDRDVQPSREHGLLAQDGVLAGQGRGGIGHNSGGGMERPGPTNGFWRDADWLRCRDERWRAVESSPFVMADDGTVRDLLAGGGRASESFTFPLAEAGEFKNRVGLLKGAGNAITLGQAVGFIQAVISSIR